MPKRLYFDGKRIGRVTVLSRIARKGCSYWKCVCDCGNIFACHSVTFKRGEKFECKKCICERRRGPQLIGRKYGRWTVVGPHTVDVRNKTVYPVLCDCGNTGLLSLGTLNHPRKSRSCGCWGRKMKSKYANSTLYPPAHGISNTIFYKIRVNIIHKCYKPTHPSYGNFGEKGITVCELWRNGARDMYDWALSKGWKEKDVLCLKEGESEFNPETTLLISNNEFRSLVGLKSGMHISYKGESHSIAKWAKILNVNQSQLRKRILKNPSVEEVFGSHFKKFTFVRDPELVKKCIELYISGESLAKIAKRFNVSPTGIRYNLIKNDIEIRKEIPNKKPLVRNEEIKKLLLLGLLPTEISKKLSVSSTTIYYRIKKILGKRRNRTNG